MVSIVVFVKLLQIEMDSNEASKKIIFVRWWYDIRMYVVPCLFPDCRWIFTSISSIYCLVLLGMNKWLECDTGIPSTSQQTFMQIA